MAAWPASPTTRLPAGGAAALNQGRARTSGSRNGALPTTGRSQAKPGSTAPTTATTPTTAASSPSSTPGPSSSPRIASHGAAAPAASSLHQPVAGALSGLVGGVEAAVTRGKLDPRLGSALVSLAEAAVYASAHGDSSKAAVDLQQAQAAISQAAGSKLVKQGTAGGAPRGLGGPPGLSGPGWGPPGHDSGPGGHGDGGSQGGQGH